MKNKIASFFSNFVLLVLSLCVAIIVAEIALPFFKIRTIEEAVYHVRRPVVQFVYGKYHRKTSYTLKKNLRNIRLSYPNQLDYTIDTNKYGFRGPDWDLSPERKNIIILGDSFAFGWGVQWEQTAGKIIENELQKQNPAFQTINLSIPGYSIKEIIRSLDLFKGLLQPVAVVYIFCPNDLESITAPVAPGVYDIEYHPPRNAEKSFQQMVARNQPDSWTWNKFYRGSYCKAYHARVIRPLFSKRIRQSLSIDPAPQGFDFPPPINPVENPAGSPEAQFLTYCLTRLRSNLQGELYLLSTSDKYDLLRKDQPNSRRWLLRKFCLENPKIHFIDFESIIRKIPDSRNCYLDFDDHWSAQGHTLAARLVLEKMKSSQCK